MMDFAMAADVAPGSARPEARERALLKKEQLASVAEILEEALHNLEYLDRARTALFEDRGIRVQDIGHLAKAAREMADKIEIKPPTKPCKDVARYVANLLAQDFKDLTGKDPTLSTRRLRGSDKYEKYGPFLDLVTEIFAILHIDASPETFARKAAEKAATLGSVLDIAK
jgi:hypothetical protein